MSLFQCYGGKFPWLLGSFQNSAVMSAVWKEAELKSFESRDRKIFTKPFKIDERRNWLDECERALDPNCKLTELPKET